jgi:hypothetical protein
MMGKMVISVPIEKYTFSELSNDLATVRINTYHNSYNPNGSFFEDDCFENSADSFKNKPICCAYEFDDEGNVVDFKEHNEEEKPIGVIPETNNYSIEEIDDLTWACVDALIFKEYCPEAYELLKDGKKISMEIEVLEGFKGKDKFFHIKRFNLLCITVLGDKWSPAMGDNATIDILNNTDSESFATKFSAIINKANEIVDKISTEGGNKMNREEIISKFSVFSKAEGYKEIVDNAELSNEELETQLFSLSQNQLNQFINEALSTVTIIKQYWDGESYETQKYWLEDVVMSDNIAVLWSREDYRNYGVPYSMSGDTVTLDFTNAKRYVVGDWRPFEDGQSEPSNPIEVFVNDIVDQAKNQINNTKESFKVKETEEYKALESDLNTKIEEFKAIEGDLNKIKADFTTLQSNKVSLDEEVKDLRQFKADKEQEFKESQVNEVLAKFTELEKVDGYDELIKDKFNYSLEELETKLKVFAFDNNVVIGKKQKFTKTNEQTPVNLPLEGKSNDGYTGAWDVLDKYTK